MSHRCPIRRPLVCGALSAIERTSGLPWPGAGPSVRQLRSARPAWRCTQSGQPRRTAVHWAAHWPADANACPLASRTIKHRRSSSGSGPRRRTRGGRKWRGRLGSGAPRALAYCAFGFSDGLGAGAEPVGAAFFFFFFFFGASLGCWASGCWASAFDAVRTVTGTAKLAANPTRRNNFRRVTCGSISSLMANPSAYGDYAG